MRRITLTLCLGSAVALSACASGNDQDVDKALDAVNVIDEANLNDIMLMSADPNEAVAYFRRASGEHPERLDLKRGLALALTKANKPTEAVVAWSGVVSHQTSTNDDRIGYADALIRNGDWTGAKETLDGIPPTYETYRRYRLEAMVADANKDWDKADSFYETAVGLTTRPGGVLNNWGFSKLTRGDYDGAERLFTEALGYDDKLFTAKNNLVLARSAQRKYDLPIIQMSQTERAQLLYTAGLSAVKQGDTEIGKGLLQSAIDTHPQHFEAASQSLAALENNVRL